jgi:hypothetical protein
MLKARSERTQRDGAQFAIAVFDSWDALLGFFKKERTGTPSTSDAVLHARTDDPPLTLRSGLLKEMTQLRFTRGAIACTSGPIADELASRLTGGAVNLANALRVWLSSQQARELASHVEKGHVVLWLELRTSEEFGDLCGRLVQASPHLVELCNIKFGS